jgi:hypothetical protein
MTMRKITNIILLSAGILLSLTGCQKGNEAENSDGAVRFSASTNAETRTAYSGVRDSEKERIDWSADDKIMIWSDLAAVPEGRTPYFAGNPNLAVYGLTNIKVSDIKSVANITSQSSALHYPENDQACQFWALYPAEAVTKSFEGNTVPLKISAEQTLAENTNTTATDLNDYVPDMKEAYMLAYASGAKESGPAVDLLFKPAFTDFEFNITTKLTTPLTIKAMEIKSETTALSGKFTATCTNGTWGFTIADDAAKSVKAIMPGDGLTIQSGAMETLSLNIFALPQNLKDLKVVFYTNEGTKAMKLTIPSDKTKMKEFAACKKHRINGLILPTGWFFDYITLDLQVLKWEAVDVEGAAAEFPQATQMVVSGEGVKNGDSDLHIGGTGESRQKDPYRQMWFFKTGQTVEIWFKVMLPSEGTWQIVPKGGTYLNGPVEGDEAYFNIKNVSPDATSETALTGPIRKEGATDVKFEITYKGTDTAEHCLYFETYVIDKNGHRYCIDSETQLYDRGRGYHSFIVNSSTYQY